MSEINNKNNNTEKETTPKKTNNTKKPEKKEEKDGIFKRAGHWVKNHKSEIITGVCAFGAGAASTVGAGIVMNKRSERKRRQESTYIPETEENSLDPNI